MTELLEIEGALDAATLERIREEMRAAEGRPAGVLGQDAPSAARRATRIDVSEATRAAVTELLEGLRPRMEDHFGRRLDECEEPQFLRYAPGDYFVAHQDGNTPLLHDDSRFRRVSVVVFLSERPKEYDGGSLVLHSPAGRTRLASAPGTLVAFPAETTHEVTPIVRGERLSIVAWYRSDADATDG